jgi:hypothetical protein
MQVKGIFLGQNYCRACRPFEGLWLQLQAADLRLARVCFPGIRMGSRGRTRCRSLRAWLRISLCEQALEARDFDLDDQKFVPVFVVSKRARMLGFPRDAFCVMYHNAGCHVLRSCPWSEDVVRLDIMAGGLGQTLRTTPHVTIVGLELPA